MIVQRPPTRRSHSRLDDPARVVRARRRPAWPSWEVNASKTTSGGASITRSSRSSSVIGAPRRTRRTDPAGAPTRAGSRSIQPVASSSCAGPSRHSRARPTFAVMTRSTVSRMPTCFLRPLSVRPNGSASSPIVAGPRASRSRMPRRVGSERAKNVRSRVPLWCTDRCTIARHRGREGGRMNDEPRSASSSSTCRCRWTASPLAATGRWTGSASAQPYDGHRQRAVAELLGQTGLLVLGGRAGQDMAQAWPSSRSATGEFMNALPKVVFSSTLTDVEWGNARVTDRPAEEEIPELKGEAGQGHRRLRRSELRPLARRPRPDRRVPHQRPAGRARRRPAAAAGLPEPLRLELVSSTAWADGPITQPTWR